MNVYEITWTYPASNLVYFLFWPLSSSSSLNRIASRACSDSCRHIWHYFLFSTYLCPFSFLKCTQHDFARIKCLHKQPKGPANVPSSLSHSVSLQSTISTTGFQTDPARVQVIAAFASTTRWTHWCGRQGSVLAWPYSNSTCCSPVSSRSGWTPSKCPTALARTAPSASCTSRSPAQWLCRQLPPPAPPQETGRWAPWWTVTSAARRNWWCWAEPVPPRPTTWWLCPVKEARRRLGLRFVQDHTVAGQIIWSDQGEPF